jgi:hypothetical protein
LRNPVAKNMRGKSGPFKDKDTDGRAYKKKKIRKEVDEFDEKYIKEEVDEYSPQRDHS